MENVNNSKKCGLGTLSLPVAIFAIMFSFTVIAGKTVGEYILNSINISFPTAIISLILFLISGFIGYKFKKDYLAKNGMVISCIFLGLIFCLSFLSL